MPPVTTEAVVLSTIPYRETSRIVPLAPRDPGGEVFWIPEVAPAVAVEPLALRSLWRMVTVLGFAPALGACARCGAAAGPGSACFSPQDGGLLCSNCAREIVGSQLRPGDRAALAAWLDPEAELPVLDEGQLAAHRRLLERYIRFHLAEGALLPALTFWAQRSWLAP